LKTSLGKRQLVNEIGKLKYGSGMSLVDFVRKRADLEHFYDPTMTEAQIADIFFESLSVTTRNQLLG